MTMPEIQIVISVISIIISVLTLLGVGVATKHFWDDKHEKAKASKAEAKEKAKQERQAEIREVIQQENSVLKAELQKEMNALKEEMADLKKGVNDVKEKVDRLQHSMVTVDRIIMKLTLDQYKTQGYASASDRAAWSELYEDYKNLGGNHFREYVNQWKKSLENLPNRDDITIVVQNKE